MENWWVVVLSVIIPLLAFMIALRPWIRDVAKSAVGDVGVELASLKAELKAYRENRKEFIDLYKLITQPGNPHPDKDALLEKLKNDTITRDEAITLQQIMNEERQKAEAQNDLLKAVIIIGILALVAAALSK
jgi:hypothetical protein